MPVSVSALSGGVSYGLVGWERGWLGKGLVGVCGGFCRRAFKELDMKDARGSNKVLVISYIIFPPPYTSESVELLHQFQF